MLGLAPHSKTQLPKPCCQGLSPHTLMTWAQADISSGTSRDPPSPRGHRDKVGSIQGLPQACGDLIPSRTPPPAQMGLPAPLPWRPTLTHSCGCQLLLKSPRCQAPDGLRLRIGCGLHAHPHSLPVRVKRNNQCCC